MGKQTLKLVTDTDDYFLELLNEAKSLSRLEISKEIEVYLLGVLKQFLTSENLFQRDGDGKNREEALALMMKQALEEESLMSQRTLFRYLGDISLYRASFFQERIRRQLVDVNYYIGIGEMAYRGVAQRSDERSAKELFTALSDSLPQCIEILTTVSEKTIPQTSEIDLLRCYDLWTKTGSERAASALRKAGIKLDVPASDSKVNKNKKLN